MEEECHREPQLKNINCSLGVRLVGLLSLTHLLVIKVQSGKLIVAVHLR